MTIAGLTDQSQTLDRKKLLLTLSCLTASLFVSFFDQTAVSTAIPSISKDLHHAFLINSWTSTSYLIANTNFQLLYGRFSDIFGRKQIFVFSLVCLMVGDLGCGFAKNPTMLFIFRGLSGIGGGGVNCLVMITFSDLLSPRQRGKYFGIVAAATSAGNGIGPFIGGLLSEHASWRWAFWLSCPICLVCGLLLILFVPLKPVEGSFKKKIKLIDWFGFITSMIFSVLFLVAISGGNESWPWKSATFISLIIISSIAFFCFIGVEQYYAEIPLIPLRLFTDLQRFLLFLSCFSMGLAYFVDIYYLPLYLQNYRGWQPMIAGVIQLPATCTSSIFGVVVGQINSRTGRYVQCLWAGGALWALGSGLKLMYDSNTSIGYIVGTNIIQGCGIGFTFQPTLLALLANSDSADRAVVTGLRNFFRCFGGSVGLVISGIAFNATLRSQLRSKVPLSVTEAVVSNPAVMQDLNGDVRIHVFEAYLKSYKTVLFILIAFSGLTFLVSILTRDVVIPDTSKTEVRDDEDEETIVKDSKSDSTIVVVEERK
ncbi:hypothetical protein G9P44_003433 [Scheffersomyces stipitis]|nr:hypothetical protein G9P44_003433 [Scheffersomyces stipitis]